MNTEESGSLKWAISPFSAKHFFIFIVCITSDVLLEKKYNNVAVGKIRSKTAAAIAKNFFL